MRAVAAVAPRDRRDGGPAGGDGRPRRRRGPDPPFRVAPPPGRPGAPPRGSSAMWTTSPRRSRRPCWVSWTVRSRWGATAGSARGGRGAVGKGRHRATGVVRLRDGRASTPPRRDAGSGQRLHYVTYPWVVSSQRLRAAGWRPSFDNAMALEAVLDEIGGRHAVASRRIGRRETGDARGGRGNRRRAGTAAVVRRAGAGAAPDAGTGEGRFAPWRSSGCSPCVTSRCPWTRCSRRSTTRGRWDLCVRRHGARRRRRSRRARLPDYTPTRPWTRSCARWPTTWSEPSRSER